MNDQTKIKLWLYFFMAGLLISGITAFPLEWELNLLNQTVGIGTNFGNHFPSFSEWVSKVHLGLVETNRQFPFIAYGTDWLAFAHIILAILFIGPLKDPVKNIWVIEFGVIACVLVIPLAMICGEIRGIPIFWRLIDCSFGVLGVIPLLVVRRKIKLLELGSH